MQLHWHTEPFLLLSLLGLGWAYALCLWPLREKIAPGERVRARDPICFYLGLGLIYIAVGSPIDSIGEQFLFSVHMFQHMLLMFFVPVLLYNGLPGWLCDGILRLSPGFRKVWRFLTHPVFAGLFIVVNYGVWHIPWVYEAALRDKTIHIMEHAFMFGTAFLMFWGLMSRSKLVPQSSYPTKMLTIFLVTIGFMPVFGMLAFSGQVLYPTYEWAPRIVNISPLEDQVLGAVIMKVIGMIFGLGGLGLNFYLWAREQTKDDLVYDSIPAQPESTVA
jgi:putative membrane protein